jgi:hypothetical protein
MKFILPVAMIVRDDAFIFRFYREKGIDCFSSEGEQCIRFEKVTENKH